MKFLKILARLFLVCLVLLIIFWAGIVVFLQTTGGQKWAYTRLMQYIEKKTDLQIVIERISLSFPLHLHLHHLALSQDNRLLVSVDDFSIACLSPHLFEGKLVCSSLYADGITLHSLPKQTAKKTE